MSEQVFQATELEAMSPKEFRNIVRRQEWTGPTNNPIVCRGYAQANLAIVPEEYAFEFLLFCQRNPYPCPVIEVTDPGDPRPKLLASDADIRTDLPKYSIYKDGVLVDEPTDIVQYWRNDLVAFLIGCGASFVWALQAANVKFRRIGVYTSNIQCVPTGRFHGPMIVSCRLVKNGHDAVRIIQITSRLLKMHGPPIHIGNPEMIGIEDLYQPDVFSFGQVAPQEPDEVAMFWGCGATPYAVALASKVPLMITHCPGHMFVTERLTEELAIF